MQRSVGVCLHSPEDSDRLDLRSESVGVASLTRTSSLCARVCRDRWLGASRVLARRLLPEPHLDSPVQLATVGRVVMRYGLCIPKTSRGHSACWYLSI